jgi:hypothetical protein
MRPDNFKVRNFRVKRLGDLAVDMRDWRLGMEDSGDCAERSWRKSTWSGSGNCVEVANHGVKRLVRHSKDPGGLELVFTEDEWKAFLAGAKAGEFD